MRPLPAWTISDVTNSVTSARDTKKVIVRCLYRWNWHGRGMRLCWDSRMLPSAPFAIHWHHRGAALPLRYIMTQQTVTTPEGSPLFHHSPDWRSSPSLDHEHTDSLNARNWTEPFLHRAVNRYPSPRDKSVLLVGYSAGQIHRWQFDFSNIHNLLLSSYSII